MKTLPLKDAILSVRIPSEMDERLKKAAKALYLTKNDVARGALRAALDAMEMRRYKIEWPLSMKAEPAKRMTRAEILEEKDMTRAVLDDIKNQVKEILDKQWEQYERREARRRKKG